jgi:hypothetical protein
MLSFWSITNHQEFGGNLLDYLVENSDNIFHTLYFSEVGGMCDDTLAVWGDDAFEMAFIYFFEPVEIDKVVDYLNVFGGIEKQVGLFFEVLRHGGYPVAFIKD